MAYINRSNRKGRVYLAKTPLYPIDLKIGFTEKRTATDRLKGFNTGLKPKHHYRALFSVPVNRCYDSEQKLFRILKNRGYSRFRGKEMFRIYPWQVKSIMYYMKKYISNIPAHNTISWWHKYDWRYISSMIFAVYLIKILYF